MMLAAMIPHIFTSGAALSAGSTALAAGGSLFSAGTVAGVGTAAATAAGSSGVLSLLSNGLSIASAAGSLFSGVQQSNAAQANAQMQGRALEMQSKEELMAARQEEILGKREANDITDRLIRTISEQRLASSANGMDPTFGTPVNVENNTRDFADLQLSTSRKDARVRVMARRRGASERLLERTNVLAAGKSASSSAMLGGVTNAAGTLGNLAMRGAARG